MRRFLCVFLSFVLCLCIFLSGQQESEAFTPLVIAGVTIAPEVVAGAATLLTAAGVTFATSDSAKEAVKDLYLTSTTTMRGAIGLLDYGINNVSDYMWTNVWNYVKSKFSNVLGSHDYTSTYYETNDIGDGSVYYPFTVSSSARPFLGSNYIATTSGTLGGLSFVAGDEIALGLYLNGNYYYYWTVNGVKSSAYLTYGVNPSELNKAYYDMYILLTGGYYKLYVYYYSTSGMKDSQCPVDVINQAQETSLPVNPVVYYETKNPATLSTYDFKDDSNRRDVLVPEGDGIVNQTYSDVQNQTVVDGTPAAITGDVTTTMSESDLGFWESLFDPLTSLVDAIYELLQSLYNNIVGFFTDPLTVTPVDLKEQMEDKLAKVPLQTAIEQINTLSTATPTPPVIRINLAQLFTAGTSRFGTYTNPFSDNVVFFDFGMLEDYSFLGVDIVTFFRGLIGAGMIWTTLLYVWRKIVPREVIS